VGGNEIVELHSAGGAFLTPPKAASSLSPVFGSIGGPEVILLFIAALLLFGPRRLPEIGRTLGKTVADFRRATNEFKMNLEREVRMDELKETIRPIENAPRPETLARGVLQDVTSPAAPASSAEPEPSASSTDTPAIDGGPSSVH
jgi:Tat protein translocase TatB subunit